MQRREFIKFTAGAAAWPLAARAQQPERMRRIAVLMADRGDSSEAQARVATLQEGLKKLGWKLGGNLHIDYRWGADDAEHAQAAAAELLTLSPELIVTSGSPATAALHRATSTLPIVFTIVSEPVAQGFVQSLAHPGGNITGFTNLEPTVGGKWLELLKEIAPEITGVGIIINPRAFPLGTRFADSAQAAAEKFGVKANTFPVQEAADIERIMTTFAREPGGGLIFPVDPFTSFHRKFIIMLAGHLQLPAIYGFRYFTDEGGLASYGAEPGDVYRQAAKYVDQILRGKTPADLPVQQPTKFELVINLKTAKALRLTVPQHILLLANEVIE